jgi:ubiquinone/menaquinone biosynthesis C-methylase UbiE
MAIAMIGAKSGDRLVVVGGRDPDLAAELALVTGLNGQTTVIDDDPATEARVSNAAGRAGSLVDVLAGTALALPPDAETHDVIVVMTALSPMGMDERRRAVAEALRLLRTGGRLLVIDGSRRTGLFGGGQERDRMPPDQMVALLQEGGARAARQLADADGVGYFEARK